MTDRNVLVVGERFNMARYPHWERMFSEDLNRWLRISVRLGCFRRGPGRRKLASIGLNLGAEGADSLNLLPPDPRPGAWDAARANLAAREVLRNDLGRFYRWEKLVLCGRRVQRAFGVDLASGSFSADHKFFACPHPSGRCRAWNDDEEMRRIKKTLKIFLAWTPKPAPVMMPSDPTAEDQAGRERSAGGYRAESNGVARRASREDQGDGHVSPAGEDSSPDRAPAARDDQPRGS